MGRFLKAALGLVLGGLLLLAGFSALFSVATDTGEDGEDGGLATLAVAVTDSLEHGGDAALEQERVGGTDGEPPPAEPARTFSGSGGNSTMRLGTIVVTADSELRWTHREDPAGGGFFIVQDEGAGLEVNSGGRRGTRALAPGTYRNVEVVASGPWTMIVGPR